MSKKKARIKFTEIQEIVVGDVPVYPKYVTQILNLANQNAQGTRARVVGQMSELIQEFEGSNIEEWIEWYELGHPDARKNAADKIEAMIAKFREAIQEIDRPTIDTWVKDLVLYNDVRWTAVSGGHPQESRGTERDKLQTGSSRRGESRHRWIHWLHPSQHKTGHVQVKTWARGRDPCRDHLL